MPLRESTVLRFRFSDVFYCLPVTVFDYKIMSIPWGLLTCCFLNPLNTDFLTHSTSFR
jgi:hypothetical protein